MVEEKVKETTITSSGSAWQVMVIIAGMLLLFFVGYKRIKV
jgi:cobaltochelatase CobN